VAFEVSVPAGQTCGFNLDYLTIWKLPPPKK
jgi:hypothetical protein